MKKAVYHLSGFDCPNCALKAERHLSKKSGIARAQIDFTTERLYLEFSKDELPIEKIRAYIKEVESAPIRLMKAADHPHHPDRYVLSKRFRFLLVRVIIAFVLILIARFAFPTTNNENGREIIAPWAIVLYVIALLISLYEIFFRFLKNILHRVDPIDENLLMLLASLGAFVIYAFPEGEPEFFDGVMVLILYQIGTLLENVATSKAKDAIAGAIDLRADIAHLVLKDKIVKVPPEDLKVGDLILVSVGEIVPADGTVISGNGSFDMSSLNGEPAPVGIKPGASALSGTILRSGSVTIRVEKVFKDSTISKIMAVVEEGNLNKARAERFITRFARIYTPLIMALAVISIIAFGLYGQFALGEAKAWVDAFQKGIQVLIVGCPCAIVISIPLAYFAGIGLASRHGVIIKGTAHLDRLARIGVLCLDKTGTLTYGRFQVEKIVPLTMPEPAFLTYLLAAESRSDHPIAKAITLHQKTAELALKQKNYEEIAGQGVKTVCDGHELIAGTRKLLLEQGISVPRITQDGTLVFLAVDHVLAGYVVLGDLVRDRARRLIALLTDLKIRTVLLSGDRPASVAVVAQKVGIREWHAEMLPAAKTDFLAQEMRQRKDRRLIAFAGDGINDTPSIIRADVGFAMGGIGSDIAVKNSDVVIMQDHPLKIYDAIIIARKTKRVAVFNIVFTLLVKAVVLILIFAGIIDRLPPEIKMPIIVLADSGLALLLTLNSLLLLFRRVRYPRK